MDNNNMQAQQMRLQQYLAANQPELLESLAELVKSREEALSSSQMKSEFLANMSHEIRTPLHGIVGTTDLLMETAENKEQLELLQTLKISNETLLHVINDVLDFSKVEHGQLKLEKRSFELADICDSVVQLFQGTAQDKRLELISDYSPQPLPRIVGDPLRLRQIISNLVSNALKFTLQGSVSLSVVVADECIRITVTDTGIGISEASQQTLFDPFTQADQSTTKRYGGSGLGLAICAQFATLMGGSIEVESQTNQGSTFTVTLPLTLAQDKAPAAAPANGDLSLPQHPWILLVDDNAINRKVGTRLIESLGCSVMLAGSGPEAISACRENQFSAVLMDIQMPEMDGVEAMHAIRALAENTAPIIALTAYASIGDRDRYLSAGFDDYLEKPLKKKRLWEALSHCISTPDNENKDALTNIQQMPVLNQHAYEEFVELMDEEAPGLIERFQLDMDDACKEIAALAHQAPDECSKVAHKLKSSAGYIGAERMRGMFEWLELEMTNADKPQQQAALTLAEETAAATAAALQAPLA